MGDQIQELIDEAVAQERQRCLALFETVAGYGRLMDIDGGEAAEVFGTVVSMQIECGTEPDDPDCFEVHTQGCTVIDDETCQLYQIMALTWNADRREDGFIGSITKSRSRGLWTAWVPGRGPVEEAKTTDLETPREAIECLLVHWKTHGKSE